MRRWPAASCVVLVAGLACSDAGGGSGTDTEADESATGATTAGQTASASAGDDATGTGEGSTGTTGSDACGNGELDDAEQCDDGNSVPDDGCESDCTITPGTPLWTVTYDGPGSQDDVAHAVAVDSLDNIVVAGFQDGARADVWVRKLDPQGQTLWTHTHDGPMGRADRASSVAIDADDNLVVGGTTTVGVMPLEQQLWLQKLVPDGRVLWTVTHPASTDGQVAEVTDVAIDLQGNIAVAGFETVAGQEENVWVALYDDMGQLSWSDTWDGAASTADKALGVELDATGNVIAVGQEGVTSESWNGWVRKYDPDGNRLWASAFDSLPSETDGSAGIATTGDVIVVIGSHRGPLAEWSAHVQKLANDGTEAWTATVTGMVGMGAFGRAVALADDESIAFAGVTTLTGQDDIMAGRMAADGSQLWATRHDGDASGRDVGFGVAVDSLGDVIVVGSESVSGQGTNAWIRKLAQ